MSIYTVTICIDDEHASGNIDITVDDVESEEIAIDKAIDLFKTKFEIIDVIISN